MTKLVLGTANFGQKYGIANDPVPSVQEIENIARVAWAGGIRVIHTSWQYELPKICEAIFSKFEWIKKEKENPDWFTFDGRTGRAIYNPDEVKFFTINDIIQVPFNVLDNRFKKYLSYGCEIHARSVFLQGLLLMDLMDMPDWIVDSMAFDNILHFLQICMKRKLEPYAGALGYVLGLDEVDRVIVGVNSAKQLKQLLSVKPLKWDYDFSITDEMVLNPNRWPRT